MADACRALGLPVVGGNVSLYNETAGVDIDPTPVIGIVGVVDRLDRRPPGVGLVDGHRLLLLGADGPAPAAPTLAGSRWAADSRRHSAIPRAGCSTRSTCWLVAADEPAWCTTWSGAGIALAEMCTTWPRATAWTPPPWPRWCCPCAGWRSFANGRPRRRRRLPPSACARRRGRVVVCVPIDAIGRGDLLAPPSAPGWPRATGATGRGCQAGRRFAWRHRRSPRRRCARGPFEDRFHRPPGAHSIPGRPVLDGPSRRVRTGGGRAA